jgi:hypothetical protein
MTLSRRTALTALAALPAAAVMPAIAAAAVPAISVAATAAPPDAELRALVDRFADAQKRCNDLYYRADILSGEGIKQAPVPEALFWRKSDEELGLPKPYYVGVLDEKKAFDRSTVNQLRRETWWFTSAERDGDRLTLVQDKRAPAPTARARADEIISAWDQWHKEPKPRRGHKKALREARKVDNEIDDLASQIADVECLTPGDLCEKIKCLMAYDGANAIEDLNLDQGDISEGMTLSIFRDIFAMAGKAAA